MHIGGARTALFNWLYARHTGGKFILRIEDTDAARNTQPAVDVILNGLRWMGLHWDEGPLTSAATGPCKGDRGPYYQSQRQESYQRRVEALLSHGIVVITVGGGGIPVIDPGDGQYQGMAAVIDKDYASSRAGPGDRRRPAHDLHRRREGGDQLRQARPEVVVVIKDLRVRDPRTR